MIKQLLNQFRGTFAQPEPQPVNKPLDFGQLRHMMHGTEPLNFYRFHKLITEAYQTNPIEFQTQWVPYIQSFNLYWTPESTYELRDMAHVLAELLPTLRIGILDFMDADDFLSILNTCEHVPYMDCTKIWGTDEQVLQCFSMAQKLKILCLAPGHVHLVAGCNFEHLEHLLIDQRGSFLLENDYKLSIHTLMQKPWMQNLRSLSLYPKRITSVAPLFPNVAYNNVSQLEQLTLGHTEVDATHIERIHRQLPQLTSLTLSNCQIDDGTMKLLGKGHIPTLEHLAIHHTNLSTRQLELLRQRNSNLTHLELMDCKLDHETLFTISDSILGERLCFLNLWDNYPTESTVYEGHIDMVTTMVPRSNGRTRWYRYGLHVPKEHVDSAIEGLSEEQIQSLAFVDGHTHCRLDSGEMEGVNDYVCNTKRRLGVFDEQFKPLLITPTRDVAFHLKRVIAMLV